MDKVVLVTGSESLTGRKLIEKLLARGSRVIAPVAGKGTDTSETGTENLTVLTWNRSSWFSTKAVVRETLRRFGRLDAAWILHRSTRDPGPFAEIGSGDVEEILEQNVKGTVALARDLLAAFEGSEAYLGMVLPHRSGGPGGVLESLSEGAFSGFADSFIKDSGPAIWACGLQSSSPDADGFADAIIKLWEEKPVKHRGRWYRFSDGRRAFGGSSFSDSLR